MILYFGCRKQEEDFIYEDELQEYVTNGTLTKVILCFYNFNIYIKYFNLIKIDAPKFYFLNYILAAFSLFA